MGALNEQVGGDHYTSQEIQPLELAYYIGGTPCFCKLAKYLSRNKEDKLEDLKKAKHIIEVEWALSSFVNTDRSAVEISIANYWINKFNAKASIQKALSDLYNGFYSLAAEELRILINKEEDRINGKTNRL